MAQEACQLSLADMLDRTRVLLDRPQALPEFAAFMASLPLLMLCMLCY